MVLHCIWLRAAASIYESSQKSHSSWKPGSWTVGAVRATSSDVARLEQPTGLWSFPRKMKGMRPCNCVCLWENWCWSVPSDSHLRPSALINSKACNLLHIQIVKGTWQLTTVKVEGRGPGVSLLASSQVSSGCSAHLCCHLCLALPSGESQDSLFF